MERNNMVRNTKNIYLKKNFFRDTTVEKTGENFPREEKENSRSKKAKEKKKKVIFL